MVRGMHRCVEHACAGTWWWWCCARACSMHHRGLGTGQRRRARVSGPVIRKGGSGTRSYSNWECAGLSPPQHAFVLYYIRAISVRYPRIRTISVRYPRARTSRYPRTSVRISNAHPPHIHTHIHRTSNAHPTHAHRTSGFPDVRNTSLCLRGVTCAGPLDEIANAQKIAKHA